MISFLSTVYNWVVNPNGVQPQNETHTAGSRLFSKYYKSFAAETDSPPVPVPVNSHWSSLSQFGQTLSTLSELISVYSYGMFMIQNGEKMLKKVFPRVSQLEQDMANELVYYSRSYLFYRISLEHAKKPKEYSDPKTWKEIAKEMEPCIKQAFEELGICIRRIFVGYLDREGFSASVFEEIDPEYKPIRFDDEVITTQRKDVYFAKLISVAPDSVKALANLVKGCSRACLEYHALVKETSEIHYQISSFACDQVHALVSREVEDEEKHWGMRRFASHQSV